MHYSKSLANFSLYTLIDITNTNITNPKTDSFKFYQFQNYNTFIQTISLRTQPEIVSCKYLGNKDLSKFNFGAEFKKRKVWKIDFECENPSAWISDQNPVGLLIKDFHGVPVHINLSENIKLSIPIIDTISDDTRNTYFIFNNVR